MSKTKQRIIDLLSDGRARHYKTIARKLKIPEATSACYVGILRRSGHLERAYLTVKQARPGFVTVPHSVKIQSIEL